MSHWHRPATEGAKFWISCKQPAFLSILDAYNKLKIQRPLLLGSVNATSEMDEPVSDTNTV